jgi:hypothetical protein
VYHAPPIKAGKIFRKYDEVKTGDPSKDLRYFTPITPVDKGKAKAPLRLRLKPVSRIEPVTR